MTNFGKDMQYAIRTLTKNPGFAIIGIITLALGMAVNTTLFSVVNGFLLRPLPVPHPEQITVLALQQSALPRLNRFSYPDYEDIRDQSDSFRDVFGYRLTLASITADKRGDHCLVSRVTSNYFSALGVNPAYGRLILPSEGRTPGADPVIVLGYAYWRKRFAGDPEIVGKQVLVNEHPLTVVGVASKDFHGTYSVLDMDAYVPFSADVDDPTDSPVEKDWTNRVSRTFTLLARLKPGVTVQQAQASLTVLAKRMAQQHPDTEQGLTIQIYPEKLARPDPDPQNPIPATAIAFMALAGLVLLVACFNIANVLLVRATVRQREMAIRAALGAGQGRLVRQYLTESLLLAFLGGGAGLLLGTWAAAFLGSLKLGTDLPVQFDFHPDFRVYLFSLAAVLLTGLVVGIMPALRAARTNVISVLREGGRGSSSGPKRQWARNSLVAAQVAGSLVLLIVAGLFIRSLDKAQKINLGFNPDHVLNLSVDVGQIDYKEQRGREFFRELDNRIRTLPGVENVAEAFTVPLGVISSGARVWIKDHPLEAGQQPGDMSYNQVTPGYFDTVQMPMLRGRKFTDMDSEKAPSIAIINQTMAQKFWPNEDALGRLFSIKSPTGPFVEVVGIVQDAKYQSILDDPQPYFYMPLEQEYQPLRTIHVRTTVPPETLALQVEAQIQELAPGLPVTQVQTMSDSLQGANGFFFFRFGA
ncbi:MAG: ABC transporter permease, partial [Candidatus Acidiferrum sp.]